MAWVHQAGAPIPIKSSNRFERDAEAEGLRAMLGTDAANVTGIQMYGYQSSKAAAQQQNAPPPPPLPSGGGGAAAAKPQGRDRSDRVKPAAPSRVQPLPAGAATEHKGIPIIIVPASKWAAAPGTGGF